MRVLIHVQHLLGTGHLQRAARIAHALSDRGAEVLLVSGGMSVPTIDTAGLQWHQLEPVRAEDAGFNTIVDRDGLTVSAALWQRRTVSLVSRALEFKPDVVLIESWPFGRRVIRFELLALLGALRHQADPPRVLCSVRDILQRGRKSKRLDESVRLIQHWFDAVLVHSDPVFAKLEHSFERAEDIAEKLHYTGFIVRDGLEPDPGDDTPVRDGGIVVSAGGGAVGHALYQAAIDVARSMDTLPWRILVGRNVAEADFNCLQTQAPAHATVQWARPDFPHLLRRATLSVSQAGYNTVMELLASRCPAVIVPFADGGETEQRDRATRLAALGLAVVIEAGQMHETLHSAVKTALALPGVDVPALGFDGAGVTADWIMRHMGSSRTP